MNNSQSKKPFAYCKYIKNTVDEPFGDNFMNGELCFGSAKRYIDLEEKHGETEQGDRFEGIFARLRKNDTKISYYQKKYGSDLEIIDDNEYVMLRRFSTKKIPVLCFYAISDEYLASKIDKKNIFCLDSRHYAIIEFDFERRMYHFSGDVKTNVLITFSKVEMEHIMAELNSKSLFHKEQQVDYSKKDSDVFDLEPTDEREELFYKNSRFEYQQEFRIILPYNKIHATKPLKYLKKITISPFKKSKSISIGKPDMLFRYFVAGHPNENTNSDTREEQE